MNPAQSNTTAVQPTWGCFGNRHAFVPPYSRCVCGKLAGSLPPTVRTFDHSKLTRRHWLPGLGPCACEHCVKLTDVDPSPPPASDYSEAEMADIRRGTRAAVEMDQFTVTVKPIVMDGGRRAWIAEIDGASWGILSGINDTPGNALVTLGQGIQADAEHGVNR